MPKGSVNTARSRRKLAGQQMVNLQVGAFNFYHLDSPKNCNVVTKHFPENRNLTSEQRELVN